VVTLRQIAPIFQRARQLRHGPPARPLITLPVVVSLTSIPSRLGFVDLAVRSLLAQRQGPEQVWLWLHPSHATDLPTRLRSLVGDRFAIRYVEGTSSYRKLLPALAAAPNTVLVTADDDVMYDPEWLARLWATHERYPRDVVAHEARCISYASDGTLRPYVRWPRETRAGACYPALLPIGFGGTLYPVGSLHTDVLDEARALTLAPSADDLWFKAMSLRAGTASRRVDDALPPPLPAPGAKRSALSVRNIVGDRNRSQWAALDQAFGFGRLAAL
jgi:hypothetical protein